MGQPPLLRTKEPGAGRLAGLVGQGGVEGGGAVSRSPMAMLRTAAAMRGERRAVASSLC